MFSWILALSLALLLGGVASAYLWLVKRRQTEVQHGLAALAGMRWREFSRIVHQAMAEQRDLHPLADNDDNDRGTSSDFLLQRAGQRWLVSCKHGRAYRFGAAAINDLAAAVDLTGAQGGILITEGQVERDGLSAAGKNAIEVIDDKLLWALLKPYVASDTRNMVTGIARREAVRHTGIAVLAAITLGLLAGMGYMTLSDDGSSGDTPPAHVASAPAATPPAPRPDAPAAAAAGGNVAAPAPQGAATGAVNERGNQVQDPDEQTLARYQKEVSKTLATTPGVVSGIWLTRSTLAIERTGDATEIWPRICTVLQHYPSLRTTRVQLNPRPGVEEPVRWRQCSTI
ncbi:restriction endonuclease [Stenotrophomonas sp.]|uniref:restriction endonuclease n=1 Tax=Stenotrophomonas sp. TaxID=69392 RepID=UPI0028AB979D|nr:restriction endonuclease [Stenotrophomonas sp.]